MPTLGNVPRPAYVYDTETDTWVPIGVGAHTHDYIPNTLVDAKGDILTATANDVPARLAKGADGTVLVSDSTTSTGLAWQPYAAPFAAGKNKVINGDFAIWQRGSGTFGHNVYNADRWVSEVYGGTATFTRQSFTPGSAPASGYESEYFIRINATSAGDICLAHRIEDARTFAGQTVTLSFWAKASANTQLQYILLGQRFGSGGSTENLQLLIPNQAINTSWTRYSVTTTLPSVSGKTLGTGNYLLIRFDLDQSYVGSLDLWGVQLEAGSVATPFTTATGTAQSELAACQRYYYRINAEHTYGILCSVGYANSTSQWYGRVQHPITMRTAPASVEYGGSFRLTDGPAGYTTSVISIPGVNNKYYTEIAASTSGMTQYRTVYLQGSNDANAYLGFSAEL